MFKVKINDSKVVKGIFEAVTAIISETQLKVTSTGISLTAMDLSHICLVSMNISKDDLDEFETDQDYELGINLEDLVKIIKRSSANDAIIFSHNPKDKKLVIEMRPESGKKARKFTMALIDIEGEDINMESLEAMEFDNKCSVDIGIIDEAIKDGAELLLNTEVKHILHKNGKAIGISAIKKGSKLEIYGKNVILSAGALETPRILQNSGISKAGKGLALDVFQTTYGYTEDVGMQNEIILATYLDKFIEDKELFPAPYMYIPLYLVRDIEGYAPVKISIANQIKIALKAKRINAKRLIGMMTKIRDEISGEVRNDGTIRKTLTKRDKEKLDEAHEINKKILIAAGANPKTILKGIYESGHPCCTAPIGKIVDENQETEIKGLFVSDASIFPSPLGMPPILTIVAFSKRLARYLPSCA